MLLLDAVFIVDILGLAISLIFFELSSSLSNNEAMVANFRDKADIATTGRSQGRAGSLTLPPPGTIQVMVPTKQNGPTMSGNQDPLLVHRLILFHYPRTTE